MISKYQRKSNIYHTQHLRDHLKISKLPRHRILHEVDLVRRTKYCVTRQWPMPQEQVKAIDKYFESRRKKGQVRESKSPHSAAMFCVKKLQRGWRIVHAYNKLNDATIATQTLIPRKDVIIDSMPMNTIYSAHDLRNAFYNILMRESDKCIMNAPATFNRCVTTHLLRSVRDFAPSYVNDLYVHTRAVNGKTDIEMHKENLRELLGLMRKKKIYAKIKKCIVGASEILVLRCLVWKMAYALTLIMSE
ncbi:hypothetical protein PHMEG_00013878 [Phytophthora megakarya]|uniref:Reverse transcriptase n=1 Tax=Phytophthora megakarya TaxID=4795 RepID=A0A225W6Q2_9STRA|nr:hypothetical protein PHMEG_00013878 [Phytophthora megakarya]